MPAIIDRIKRPVSIVVLAAIYIVVGAIGFVSHFPDVRTGALQREDVWIEATEVLAIVCGIYLLRRQNWARWLALAWIAWHVVLSVLEAYRGFVVHCLLFAAIAWILFRPAAARYFRLGPEH